MGVQNTSANLSVSQFAERHRREMIPLGKTFSYYFTALPLTEEDIREYLEEPIAALPPNIASRLPKVSILLVPYLEKAGKSKDKSSGELVCLEKPAKDRVSWSTPLVSRDEAVFVFALKDQEVADYHYRFYNLLARLVTTQRADDIKRRYTALLREELGSNTHGEVDEESWRTKQALLRRPGSARNESKAFNVYEQQSFIDTLTLYLHGICCDIDVETGPRQLPSRYLRKRLLLLRELYPPPKGYILFPDEPQDDRHGS